MLRIFMFFHNIRMTKNVTMNGEPVFLLAMALCIYRLTLDRARGRRTRWGEIPVYCRRTLR